MALTNWKIDPSHSAIAFSVRHMVVSKTRGRFTKWSGQLRFDPENPAASSVEVDIEPGSLDTADKDRDAHLRSADFFDVEKFPTATFRSTKVEPNGDDRYKVTGNLTIRSVTRPVVLDVTYEGAGKDPWGGERAGFNATTSLDRRHFGLEWNKTLETGGLLVGEKVDLTLEIEAIKQPAQQAA
jgi:polyisoprenoid-binding protein YceI